MFERAVMRRVSAVWALCAVWLLAAPAQAFKTSMHVRTANVAMLDARDGAICMPGLTGHLAEAGEAPLQIPLANTPLQHFWVSQDESGQPRTQFRSWLLQYAPYVRAGAVGPDGYPDMLTGQLNIHPNTSLPYECTVASSDRCDGLHGVADEARMRTTAEVVLSSIPIISSMLKYSQPRPAASPKEPTLGGLVETLTGKPHWRSIDWAHEVLYRALHYREMQEELVRNDATLTPELRLHLVRLIQEQRRGAVAFALGFFMHMIGDGHIHSLINEIVAMPWSYTSTRDGTNEVYGLMAPMQEELQHMAMERYLNESYAPGAEDPAVMSQLTGEVCAPYVELSKVNAECVPEEVLKHLPLPCHVCNPLRSTDPTDVSTRCDHCFVNKCNPWRELCTVELPPGPICQPETTCDNYARDLAQCAGQAGAEAQRTCRRGVERACSIQRERCACAAAVDVMVSTGVMTAEQATRLSCAKPGSSKLVEEADRYLGRLDAINIATNERDIPEELKRELGKVERAAGRCDTRPLSLGHIRDNLEEAPPETIDVVVDGEKIEVPGDGPVLDLNGNGQRDLLNECVMLNCQMSPHQCPFGALDEEVDERQYADILPCFEPEEEQPAPIRWATSRRHACSEVEQGFDSIDVDARALQGARSDSEIARVFMQSTYTQVPKEFVADFFYMERGYSELPTPPGLVAGREPRPHDAADFKQLNEPDTYGSFSLGGMPVNAIHATKDLLSLLDFYSQAALTDPIGLARELDPGGPLDSLMSKIPMFGGGAADKMRAIADELARSPILNFTLRIPIPFADDIVIRVEIGKALARPIYKLADALEATFDMLLAGVEQGAKRVAASINSGVQLRIEALDDHLRREWVDVTTCMMEAVTSHQDIGYAVRRLNRFLRDATQVLLLGGRACEEPMVVSQLRSAELSFEWTMGLLNEVGKLQFWIICEAERLLVQRLYDQAIAPMLENISKEVRTYIVCEQLLNLRQSDSIVKDPAKRAAAYAVCEEMMEVMTRPLSYLRLVTEPLKQALLSVNIAPARFALTKPPVKVGATATGAEFERVEGAPYSLYDYMASMRLITRGACWDGGNSELDVGPRDQVRAAFGDFDLRGPDGAHKCAKSPQPLQAIAQRAAVIFETDNVTPTNKNFGMRDAQWLYQDAEFERRAGSPVIKALDRLMQIADPYATFTHQRPQINFVTRTLEYEPMHAMNSVAFWPTYNTVQINKMAFMGPGSKSGEPCWYEPLECEGSGCRIADGICPKPISPLHSNAQKKIQGDGVYAMIFAGNSFADVDAGSGERGDPSYRRAQDVYPDASFIPDPGATLDSFFQEQYLTQHDLTQSHPGHRSCKDIRYNLLCNAIYDLDNPDDYCRNAHAWAYDMVEGLGHDELVGIQVTWPKRDFAHYSNVSLLRMGERLPFYPGSWRVQDHDNCAWLTNADDKVVHELTDAAYPLLNPNRRYIPYAPDDNRSDWAIPLRGVAVQQDSAKVNLFSSIREPNKWAYSEHARDYTPHQRSFLIDATQNTLRADARGAVDGDEYTPPPPEIAYTPTRFALANKDQHVARLYAKVLSPFYCPLAGADQLDGDCDGVPDLCDNCPQHYNPTQQRSTQKAGYTFAGDACLPNSAGVTPPSDARCMAPPRPAPDGADPAGCLGECQCDTTGNLVGGLWSAPWLLIIVGWRRRRRG